MEYLQTKVLDGMMKELLEEFEPMHVLHQLVQKNIVDTEGEKQIKARKSRKERVMTTRSTLQPKHYDDRWLLRFAEELEVSAWYRTLGGKLRKEMDCAMRELTDIQELYSVSEESFIRLSHLLQIATAIQESDARKLLEYFQVPNTNSNDLGKTLAKCLLCHKIPIIRLKEACSKFNLKYLKDINAKHDMILSFPELQGNFLVKLPASRSHKKVSLLESGTFWESSLFQKETSIKLFVFFRGEYDIHFVKLCNKSKSFRLRIESKRTLDKLLEENEAGVFGTNVAKLLYKSINGSESTPNIRLDFEKSKLDDIRKQLSTVGETSSLSSCSSLASFEAGYSEAQSTFDYLDMMDRLIQAINISDIKVLCAYLKIYSVDKILGCKNPRRNFIHVCRQRKIWTNKDTSRLVDAVRSNKLTHLENIVTGKNNDMSLWPEVTVKIAPRKPYDATFTKFKQFMLRRKRVAKSKEEKEVGLNLIFKVSTESIGKVKKDIDSGRFLQELLTIYKDETGDYALIISKAERKSIKLAYDEDQFKELFQYVANEEKSGQHTFDYLDMMDRLIETMDVSDIDLLCKYFNMDPISLERIKGSTNPKRDFILVCRRKMIWTRENTSRLLDAVKSTQLTRLQSIIEDFNDLSLCPEVTLMMKSNSPSGAFAEFEEFLLASKKRLDTLFRREFKVHLVDCEKGSIVFRLKVPSKDSLHQLIGDIHSGRLLNKVMTQKRTKMILEDGKLSMKLSYDTKEVTDASNVLKETTFSIKDQWKRALMRVQTLMEEDFDPFSLMEILTSNGTLTSSEVDELKATAKRKQRVRLFISFLETKEETIFNSFRLALEECSYYEELAKALNSEVKGSQGYHLGGVTEDMIEWSQVFDKTEAISQQCSTEEVDFDIFLDSRGKWNIERAPTKRFVEEEQMVASASTYKQFKTTKVLADKGDIYPGTTSNVGNERKDMNDPGDIFIHKQEREKTIVTEKWKKMEEKFYNPSFFCEHGSIHQYQDISRDINVLLIGKCGAGKSATGNTLLGKKIFEESETGEPETKSVQIETIQEGTFNITVVDTPGIQNEEKLLNVVDEMIDFEGGINLFLLFCEDKADQEITKVISRILAETVCDQCIVVLTNARARFVGQKKISGYIDRQNDRKGPLADLFQRVENRIIAVENCFDEEDVMIIHEQRQKLLCCLAQVIKDNKGLVYTKESFQNAKTRIKQYQDMEVRLHEFLLQTYLKTLSQQELDNIQTTLDDNVEDIMQACQVLEFCPLITEGDAMQYMSLFIQENEHEISKIQADGKRQIELWKDLEKKLYCIKCEYDNIGDYKDVPEEINILLIGKTGSGKSATGNTIIGNPSFKESGSSASVTKTINMKEIKESRFHITVIDTPGLFDTASDFENEDMVLEIAKTMINFKGGIHLLLLVLSSTARFTKEEQDTIKDIEKVLGKNIYQHCLVVLTNARATFGSNKSLQEYVKQETKDKGKFANLLKHVNNRIIAVENAFDEDFLTKKHRQKLLSCFAHIIHENKGSAFSNQAFENAKVRCEKQEEVRRKRVERDTELTHMKTILRKFLQEYLEKLTEKQLDNILPKVKKETRDIMTRSGMGQLPSITSEDVMTYAKTFIRENEVLIAKLKDVKIQEAQQQKEYEDTKQRLKDEEEANKMQSIVLPLVSDYFKRQSKQELEKIIRHKKVPDDLTDQIISALNSKKVNVNLKLIKSYIKETYVENPTQIQGYIDDKVLQEKLEEKAKQLQRVQREQKLNKIMGTLETNLYKNLESKASEDLKKLWTDLEGKEHPGSGSWVSILTEPVGSLITGSDITIKEVINLFLKQKNNRIQSILGFLLDKRQQQQEAKLLQEKEELRNSAFSIISKEIKEKLKSYLTGKTTSELLKLETQIDNREVPKDVFDKVCKKLTIAQRESLSRVEIETEILEQIKAQSDIIEELKKEVGTCFAGSTEVRIKERGIDKISNVGVDDDILVFDENGHLFYDKVYLISHAREYENITFVRLRTSSGKDLRISPGHLLPVGSLGSKVAAKDASVGNVIFTLQDGVMMPDKVTSVTYELCQGAFCPMTMHGTIVVNDIAASCYTTFFPAPLAHALLSPIRFLFSYLPLPLFNQLLPYDSKEGMPVLLLKCRSIVIGWRSLFTRNDNTSKAYKC